MAHAKLLLLACIGALCLGAKCQVPPGVTDPDATLSEPAAVPTAAGGELILPTSGTTDPAILATIASVPADSVEPAVIMSAAPTAADPAGPGASDQPIVGVSGEPRSFTARQYARAIAAIKRLQVQQQPTTPAEVTTAGVIQNVLDAHNTYRAKHQVSALSWDNTVEAAAVNWASKCIFQHEGNSPYGENLFWTSAKDATGALNAVTKAWYDEVAVYTNYANPNMADFSKWGHFTQVVWKGSTKLGCAAKVCNTGAVGTIVVCKYSPPGNFIGQFPANVLPPGSTPPPPPPTETTLPNNYYFASAGCLYSVNRNYRLCMQADANLVLYNRQSQAIWASNTVARSNKSPFGAWMRPTGQLSLFDSGNAVYWQNVAATRNDGPFKLQVQNDGNVVIYNGQNKPIWATNTVGR